MPTSRGAGQSSSSGANRSSATSPLYNNGVSALARLNELLQQNRVRKVDWLPESSGPAHNVMWKVTAVVTVAGRDSHTFTSSRHKKQKDAKLEAAHKAIQALRIT
jgi:dsRNA-specific ribonuclease